MAMSGIPSPEPMNRANGHEPTPTHSDLAGLSRGCSVVGSAFRELSDRTDDLDSRDEAGSAADCRS